LARKSKYFKKIQSRINVGAAICRPQQKMNKKYKITKDKIKGVNDNFAQNNKEMKTYDKRNSMEYL